MRLHRLFAVFVIAISAFQISAPAGAQDNARSIMEKRGLLGIWSVNCGAAASPQNTYTRYRALDQQRVQSDLMTSPTQRSEAGVIEAMVEAGSDLIYTYTKTDSTSDVIKMYVDGYRARVIELARNGTKLIADGRYLAAYGEAALTGNETQWSSKCDAPAAPAQQPAAVTEPTPAPPSQPSAGSQSASRETIPNLEGTYSVAGTNPNGSRYRGVAVITSDGGLYNFRWRIAGQTFRGQGRLSGRTLTVDWGQDSPVIYQVKDNGTLAGTWDNGRARDTLTPR